MLNPDQIVLGTDHRSIGRAGCLPTCSTPCLVHICKQIIDLIGSIVLIVLLTPVFVAISLLVYFDDRLPIIYRRRVIGITGEFDAYKFRTMRRDADALLESNSTLKAEYERNFKLTNDPRITRFGALLRRFSLDELPQLFNVLRGQMSLVGPRMITTPELKKYECTAPSCYPQSLD